MTATKDKRNAGKIRYRLEQATFKSLLEFQERLSSLCLVDRPCLSQVAKRIVSDVMADERINISIKRKRGKDPWQTDRAINR